MRRTLIRSPALLVPKPNTSRANLVKGRTLSGDENSGIFILAVFSRRDTGMAVWLRRYFSWFVVASTGCRIKEAVSKRGQALQGKRASPRFETRAAPGG